MLTDPVSPGARADDRVECLECGNWFRSVAGHVYRAHGITAAQYREAHQIPDEVRIEGDGVSARREEAAAENWSETTTAHNRA